MRTAAEALCDSVSKFCNLDESTKEGWKGRGVHPAALQGMRVLEVPMKLC